MSGALVVVPLWLALWRARWAGVGAGARTGGRVRFFDGDGLVFLVRGRELDYDDDYDDDDDDDAFRLGAHTARCSGPMRSLVVSGNSLRPALVIALGASCDCYFRVAPQRAQVCGQTYGPCGRSGFPGACRGLRLVRARCVWDTGVDGRSWSPRQTEARVALLPSKGRLRSAISTWYVANSDRARASC